MINRDFTGKRSKSYRTTDAVAEIINLAIALRRPILIEGEPGCGKTRLAYAIDEELLLDQPIRIVVKSTHQAKDLLYRYNALRRLQDAQKAGNELAQHAWPYITLELLGKAIHQRKRCVVLIDEIDKADIDFPNDLLEVLDNLSFEIDDLPEAEHVQCLEQNGFGRTVAGDWQAFPIVIITSNREKQLPDPFVRRCLYLHLCFPETAEELQDIAERNLEVDGVSFNKAVVAAAVEAFREIRKASIQGEIRRPPSTSEMIDWIKILHWTGQSPDDLRRKSLLPPYWQTLFKNQHDLEAYPASAEAGGSGDHP